MCDVRGKSTGEPAVLGFHSLQSLYSLQEACCSLWLRNLGEIANSAVLPAEGEDAFSQWVGETFCKGLESKYFQLCRPYALCYSTLPLQHESSYREYMHHRVSCVPAKLTKIGGGLDLIPRV